MLKPIEVSLMEVIPSEISLKKDLTITHKGKQIGSLNQGVINGGIFFRTGKTWTKTNSMVISDIILNGMLQYYELEKRQGVKDYVKQLALKKINTLRQSAKESDTESYLRFTKTEWGFEVEPSLHTALSCAAAAKIFKNSVRYSSGKFLVSSSLTRQRARVDSSVNILFDSRNALLLEAIAEVLFCGYYGSISAHERFERIVRRVTSAGVGGVLNGSKGNRRLVDLSSMLHSRGFSRIASSIVEGSTEFLDCSSSRLGIRVSSCALGYLAAFNFCSRISDKSLSFLGEEVRVFEGSVGSIPSFSTNEVEFLTAAIGLACSSTSYDIETGEIAGAPVLSMILGETYAEN